MFGQKITFHFTIESLNKKIKRNFNENISIATLYNTVHAFKKRGYLKEVFKSSVFKSKKIGGIIDPQREEALCMIVNMM